MKMTRIFLLAFLLPFQINSQELQRGFLDFEYQATTGRILVHLNQDMIGTELLYVTYLSTGIGSNDIGLDRGRVDRERVVKFIKFGPKLLLAHANYDYRATSDNPMERLAVEEAFAHSILAGFDVISQTDSSIVFDMTELLLTDAMGITTILEQSKQGTYELDKSRSVVWKDKCATFPLNSEFESLLTFSGKAEGIWIRSVTPSPEAISIRQHHSFVKLPDEDYHPRPFHPYSGYIPLTFIDYATDIGEPIEKKYIIRHRLKKKFPKHAQSVAEEPITYYLDPGCPEPVRSALMEGASWWDEAFQAAGYAPGTFQVKILPEGADMMDIRYNVIQWVHRKTRGWSYGRSIVDPRTGEIIKGVVTLGSLRVRQDYLIAQGLLSPFTKETETDKPMLDMALSRLKQLAAHEVGHTLGLVHNFAASMQDRASVMDYPHPLVALNEDGSINLDDAYDTHIGEWDKQVIRYGYLEVSEDSDEQSTLHLLIAESHKNGFYFITDQDARPVGGANPWAHLWDNGFDPTEELIRLMKIRDHALSRFGLNTVPNGTPLSELEKVLVPLYLSHRYQVEAVVKLIGGLKYHYYTKGDDLPLQVEPVDDEIQQKALSALLKTIQPEYLKLPAQIIDVIPPPSFGYPRNRETFSGNTGLAFDPLAPAESYVNTVFQLLLNDVRLARIHRHHSMGKSRLSVESMIDEIIRTLFEPPNLNDYDDALHFTIRQLFVSHVLEAYYNPDGDIPIKPVLLNAIHKIDKDHLTQDSPIPQEQKKYLKDFIERAAKSPEGFSGSRPAPIPPGSPIGCGASSIQN